MLQRLSSYIRINVINDVGYKMDGNDAIAFLPSLQTIKDPSIVFSFSFPLSIRYHRETLSAGTFKNTTARMTGKKSTRIHGVPSRQFF